MGSREKEHGASHHQPLLSSLVVRPSSSDGGGEGGGSGSGGGGGGGRGGGFETGEARREMPPYSRSERFSDAPGLCLFAPPYPFPICADGLRSFFTVSCMFC
ncbi:unnamed protein product [Linum tenue]|uniref:Uncharacterized protein n=1 Tax=Linum tenue TaxID=586396 RepID=A0AAV0S8F4_9ROSI|nr:unnamed protein product [Linum tenue]